MANSYTGGRIVADTASEQVIPVNKKIKISYILFIPDANNDQIILRESSTGAIAFKLSSGTAKQEEFLNFSNDPILMNGLYVDSVSTNAVAILYTTTKGAK